MAVTFTARNINTYKHILNPSVEPFISDATISIPLCNTSPSEEIHTTDAKNNNNATNINAISNNNNNEYLPTMYVLNAASLAKPHAIEQLSAELISYNVDVAVISETHLKKKMHTDSAVQITEYNMFRRDRQGRKGGGVAIYVHSSHTASEWQATPKLETQFEMLWLQVNISVHNTYFIGALYHPPTPIYQTTDLLHKIEITVIQIQLDFPRAQIILAGDFNTLSNNEIIIRTGLNSIVTQPTRGYNKLDRVYMSGPQQQEIKVCVLRSAVKSDHLAVLVYNDSSKKKPTREKHRKICKFRNHTPIQHAHFLASMTAPLEAVDLDSHRDPQSEFDQFYKTILTLLNRYYPERTVTITSTDPSFITPTIKYMLRQKNKFMRAGKIDQAATLAINIGISIKQHNRVELSHVDLISDSKSMWNKVRQLTGSCKIIGNLSENPAITANTLNTHYANISTDNHYSRPQLKHSANCQHDSSSEDVDEMTIFKILDTLHHTATGPDGIPSWFLKIGAPLFSAPIADIFNLSIRKSAVPNQWKMATIIPVSKKKNPQTESDFRPISITCVLSRIMERVIVENYIYPSFNYPPPGLNFTDQFAFQPTGSTTAALIQLIHVVTSMLETNAYVIVYAIDFSKAFDSVRHNEMLSKYSKMELPDNVYNWLVDFFCGRTHCTKYDGKKSQSLNINASVIQGSAIGPASFVIVGSDLQPLIKSNKIIKYADDIYLIIPAINNSSCAEEVENIEKWGKTNNLQLNHLKCEEIAFVPPKSRRDVAIPRPAVLNIPRVDSITILGVTLNKRFSMTQHIERTLLTCAKSLFALRTLRHHGLSPESLHGVFQATVVTRIMYASPAWWGFTTAAERNRLEAFHNRAKRLGFCSTTAAPLEDISSKADKNLFVKCASSTHLLHSQLPNKRVSRFTLRPRNHDYILTARKTNLTNSNFVNRMLFRQM